jgi:hypothetical protein
VPAEHRLSVRDGGRVREVMLVGTVTVGRSPTCEISSADPRLSRTHAAFDVVDGEVVVRDLDSRNGTKVNGAAITEHRLRVGEQVEIGPFVVELMAAPAPVVERKPVVNSDNEATVMMPARARAAALQEAAAGAAAEPPPPPVKPQDPNDSRTRLIQRPAALADILTSTPAPPASPAPPAHAAAPDTQRIKRPATDVPTNIKPPQRQAESAPSSAPASPAPAARAAATELTFANTTLLWIVPVVLISFLAGLVPDLMQPDERVPLLRAHYAALATTAVDLAKTTREPAVPIDTVTTALRGQRGVTSARIIGADGRVLAPLEQAATTVPQPSSMGDTSPRISDAAGGLVDVQVPARTADGRPVMIAMTIDPEQIHPAPGGSPLGTVLLIISLGAAWLVARRLTQITDTRLSRLGEEVELMTTRQISVGRDPFTLGGSRRILDAVTFALSAAGRIASDGPRAATSSAAAAEVPGSAAIDADAGFRIISADRGCEGLLGINASAAAGQHLIDALSDQAVSDEVMRLVTMATSDHVVSGEVVAADRGISLSISVTKGAGQAPLAIRFKRL